MRIEAFLLLAVIADVAVCYFFENLQNRRNNRRIKQFKRENRKIQNTAKYAEFVAVAEAFKK